MQEWFDLRIWNAPKVAKKLENKQANAFFSNKDISEYIRIELHLCPRKIITPMPLTSTNFNLLQLGPCFEILVTVCSFFQING